MPEGEAVQPGGEGAPEGQGGEGGLYDLSQAPEHLRPLVEPILKEIEGNATKKFQEHADYRKQWAPFEELGINQYEPQHLQEALSLIELAQDDEQFNDWLTREAEARGLLGDEEEEEEGEEPDPLQQVTQLLDQRLGPIEQHQQQFQQQQGVQQATQQVEQQMSKLHEEHGDFDDSAVYRLALSYEGPDAIDNAFKEYQRIKGAAEHGLLGDKLEQPDTPEKGGRPGTATEPILDFKKAKEIARERVRQAP